MALYSLALSKSGGSSIDSAASYNAVCLEGIVLPSYEAKEPFTEDWPDQDGLDCYDSGRVRLKASDVTIPMGIKNGSYDGIGNNNSINSNFAGLISWLTRGNELINVSCQYTGMSVSKARFVKAEPDSFEDYDGGQMMTFKLTLRIMNPST